MDFKLKGGESDGSDGGSDEKEFDWDMMFLPSSTEDPNGGLLPDYSQMEQETKMKEKEAKEEEGMFSVDLKWSFHPSPFDKILSERDKQHDLLIANLSSPETVKTLTSRPYSFKDFEIATELKRALQAQKKNSSKAITKRSERV